MALILTRFGYVQNIEHARKLHFGVILHLIRNGNWNTNESYRWPIKLWKIGDWSVYGKWT